jgi:hypothetical protein
VIQLDRHIFTALPGSSTLAEGAFYIGTAAHDADDRIIYNAATGELSYDADGSGAGKAVHFATLDPGLSLTSKNLSVIDPWVYEVATLTDCGGHNVPDASDAGSGEVATPMDSGHDAVTDSSAAASDADTTPTDSGGDGMTDAPFDLNRVLESPYIHDWDYMQYYGGWWDLPDHVISDAANAGSGEVVTPTDSGGHNVPDAAGTASGEVATPTDDSGDGTTSSPDCQICPPDIAWPDASSAGSGEVATPTDSGGHNVPDAANVPSGEVVTPTDGGGESAPADGDTLVILPYRETFIFDTALGGGNIDRIVDFSVHSDLIQLDSHVFTALPGHSALDEGALCIGAAAQDADDRIIYNSTTGALSYDADGNGPGEAVQFATLQTGLPLKWWHFDVV